MLINGVGMNINLHVHRKISVLAPSDDTKLRVKILDATLFITQVGLEPLFF